MGKKALGPKAAVLVVSAAPLRAVVVVPELMASVGRVREKRPDEVVVPVEVARRVDQWAIPIASSIVLIPMATEH